MAKFEFKPLSPLPVSRGPGHCEEDGERDLVGLKGDKRGDIWSQNGQIWGGGAQAAVAVTELYVFIPG